MKFRRIICAVCGEPINGIVYSHMMGLACFPCFVVSFQFDCAVKGCTGAGARTGEDEEIYCLNHSRELRKKGGDGS